MSNQIGKMTQNCHKVKEIILVAKFGRGLIVRILLYQKTSLFINIRYQPMN